MTGILGQGALAAAMEKMVPAPGGVPDWETMTAAFPALAALDGCAQDPVHHAEGDAGTHTRMVLESLCRDPAWAETDETGRALLFWAAAFHDSGKPATSAVEDGRITSRGHSRAGSAIARECMRRAGVRLDLREEACALVATHMIPYHLFSNDDPRRQAIRISLSCRPRHLVMHATADVEGRICADAQELRDRIALSEAVFEEEGCLDGPYPFANDESRVAYFERDGRDPAYAAWEDPRCTMTFVCGLPGSGKDTWISRNMPDVPTVSLDAIREREGISPAGEQGRVVQAAFEEARIHLRAGRDFTWNATGVTRLNRGKALQIARDYGARTRIVYIETSPARLLEQNSSRRAAVPTAVIERLAAKLEPPMRWEAHDVEWLFDGSPVTPPGCARQPGPGFGG